MKKLDPEMRLRHDLTEQMTGRWLRTWHEDGAIGPGVPDLSYVMNLGNEIDPKTSYETGWLELKALDRADKTIQIKVEASQHTWIEDHHKRVPVHFLIRVVDMCYLVPGRFHHLFTEKICVQDLDDLSIATGPFDAMAKWLPAQLRNITDRRRFNGED